MKITNENIIGKTILLGMTYLDKEENVLNRTQFCGTVVRANDQEIVIEKDKEEFYLPPDLSSIRVAPEGEYKLRSTGEIIVNPNLLTTWTVRVNESNEQSS